MPVSRKRKPKRKIVGARSAKSGKFVKKAKLKTAPATTVAVTKEVDEIPARDAATDEETEC